ncbi:MAG: azurin, partial [Verrucomicrobiota bacterium]
TFVVDPGRWRVEVERQMSSPNPWTIAFNRWGGQFQMYGGGNIAYVSAYSGWTPMRVSHGGFAGIGGGGKGCGLEILSSRHFPDEWQQGLISNHLLGYNAVLVQPLKEAGAGYANQGKIELIRSEDLAFRPVDTKVGMDGAIYVADFCNQVVGHAQYAVRHPDRDHRHGRIWRITYKGRDLLQPPPILNASILDLLDLLKSPEDVVRRNARIELGKRDDDIVFRYLDEWLNKLDPEDPEYGHHLAEALWIHQRRYHLDEAFLQRVLRAEDFNARAVATRALRFWADDLEQPLKRLKQQLNDEHPRVRMEAVIAATWMRRTLSGMDDLLVGVDPGKDRLLNGVINDLDL